MERIDLHSIFVSKLFRKVIIISSAIVLILVISIGIFCNYYIGRYQQFILKNPTQDNKTTIGIVFGSGVNNDGKPYKELQARLDSAADAITSGLVDKLILSGDNRFLDYNEPNAMIKYLTEQKGIDEKLLQPDYAGRSTYETCERAVKVFGVKKAILFSANSHLPRAIFTCRSFGIESYGIGNNVEANNATRRELLARVKSMFNVYVYGEKTILGDPININ